MVLRGASTSTACHSVGTGGEREKAHGGEKKGSWTSRPHARHQKVTAVQGEAGGEDEAEEGEGRREEPKKKGKKVRIAKPGGKKAGGGEQRIVIGRLSRNRRKFVTVVGGIDTFPDIKIKDAAKKIGKQFACGSSVSKAPSGAEEIVIQGDVLMDLPTFLETTFNIPAAKISVLST